MSRPTRLVLSGALALLLAACAGAAPSGPAPEPSAECQRDLSRAKLTPEQEAWQCGMWRGAGR